MIVGSFDGMSRVRDSDKLLVTLENNDHARSRTTCIPTSKKVQSSIDMPAITERTAAIRYIVYKIRCSEMSRGRKYLALSQTNICLVQYV